MLNGEFGMRNRRKEDAFCDVARPEGTGGYQVRWCDGPMPDGRARARTAVSTAVPEVRECGYFVTGVREYGGAGG